jgi:hypothetical protein
MIIPLILATTLSHAAITIDQRLQDRPSSEWQSSPRNSNDPSQGYFYYDGNGHTCASTPRNSNDPSQGYRMHCD